LQPSRTTPRLLRGRVVHGLVLISLAIGASLSCSLIVEGALLYSVYKFRAKKGAVAAQIHGNTRLEIGWTVGAAVILVVLTVVTFIKLPSIINPPNSSANGLAQRCCRPR
jgi:cytochrome c oxidase subunit 2